MESHPHVDYHVHFSYLNLQLDINPRPLMRHYVLFCQWGHLCQHWIEGISLALFLNDSNVSSSTV
jgi:hypothetical protein